MKTMQNFDRVSEEAVAQPTAARAVNLNFRPNERRCDQRGHTDVSTASAALLRLFNELAYGLIVVDAARQVVHINRAARGALAREQRVRVRGRALQAWHERDAKAFGEALDKTFSGKRTALKIGELQNPIMLVPLPGDVAIENIDLLPSPLGRMQPAVSHIALVFERSACSESLGVTFYAQNHGLTSGEERVLRALNEDQSVGEVADTLGTAISTIRTHVNHIREKTGAKSLRSLVANVRSVPPLMPAFGD